MMNIQFASWSRELDSIAVLFFLALIKQFVRSLFASQFSQSHSSVQWEKKKKMKKLI